MTPQRSAVPSFPFSAIVGQGAMKRALLLNAVNPAIGGVLIRGNKGTAKSTAVRSLGALLPSVEVMAGCPFSCDPLLEVTDCPHCADASGDPVVVQRPVRIVDLPVGTSEDRLVGSLDIERMIRSAEQAFEPGLLAAAHRGILYIDEVNLLSNHLVDLLLDAAAMGRNYVERDGLSVSHPARFILVGTMNPEEGELRPQLLDRFGLMVDADNVLSRDERIAVVTRRVSFEADPVAFVHAWHPAEEELRTRQAAAQVLLPRVEVPHTMLEAIAEVCTQHEVDGLRADIVIHRTASTLAAWDGRTVVNLEDVRQASLLALVHRQRRQPFEQPRLDPQRLDETLRDFEASRPREARTTATKDWAGTGESDDPAPSAAEECAPPDRDEMENGTTGQDDEHAPATARDLAPAGIGTPPAIVPPRFLRPDAQRRAASGGRVRSLSDSGIGRHIGARTPEGSARDVDLTATLRAAVPRQGARGGGGAAIQIRRSDLREKVREADSSMLIVFVVDASGSMGAQERMEATKGAVLSLLVDAYQRRDRVALVSVRGEGAELVLPPTASVERGYQQLAACATGGRTPLWAGLVEARRLIEAERRRDAGLLSLVVLVSDGRSNNSPSELTPVEATRQAAEALRQTGTRALVMDTESGYLRLGLARAIAQSLAAEYLALASLDAKEIAESVRRSSF